MLPDAELPNLVEAIAEEADPKLRTLLMMVFKGMARLEKKLDDLLKDERQLRETVLNGHAEDFDGAMQWVKERRANGGHCPRMAQFIREEQEAREANKDSFRRIRDGVLEKLLYAIMGAASYAAGLWFYFKMGIGG